MATEAHGSYTGWVTYSDGTTAGIPAEDVRSYIESGMALDGESFAGPDVLEVTSLGGGLARLDVHAEAIARDSGFVFSTDAEIPIGIGDPMDSLRADVPYFVVFPPNGSELASPLMMCDIEGLQTYRENAWRIDRIKLTRETEGGEVVEPTAGSAYKVDHLADGTPVPRTLADAGLDPEALFTFYDVNHKKWLTFGDLMNGLMILQSSVAVAMQMHPAQPAPLMLRTGKHFTESMRATSKRGKFIHPDGGEYIMAGDLMISADKVGVLSTGVGMNKTLAYLNHLATTSGYAYEPDRSCIVSTSVDEILDVRKLDHTRKNRERVRRDIKALEQWYWEFEDQKTHEWTRIRLSGGGMRIRRGGAVDFYISAPFMGAILNTKAGMLPVPPALLGTDERANPYAFTIGFKLTTHSYQNDGKPNQSTLSVEKLLEYVEDLPTAEEVKKTRNSPTYKIIAPMERDLDALVGCGVLAWWDYCHAKGEPLTPEEQAQRLDAEGKDRPLPYETAIAANIQWQLANDYAEEMEKTRAARDRHRAEALAARQAKTDRKKRIERQKDRRIADALAKRELAATDKGEAAPTD